MQINRLGSTFAALTKPTRAEFLRLAAGGGWAAASGLSLGGKSVARAREAASPEELGAAGDGVSDDTTAFQKGLERGFPIRLTPGRVYRVAKLPIRAGDHIWCEPGASTIQGPSQGSTFVVRGGGLLEGFNCVGMPEYHFQHHAESGALDGLTIKNVHVVGGRLGLYTFGYGALNKNIAVEGCYFDGVQNPIVCEHAQDSRFLENRFTAASGANIQFRMAQRCKVIGGSMDGGTTGVTFLGGFSNARFLAGTFEQNVVQGLTVRNMKEEGISFDNGGSAEDCVSRERAKIAGKSSDRDYYYVTLTTPAGSWSGSTDTFAGAYVCFFSGAATGAVCRVAHNTLNQFQFARGTSSSGQAQMTAATFAALAKAMMW